MDSGATDGVASVCVWSPAAPPVTTAVRKMGQGLLWLLIRTGCDEQDSALCSCGVGGLVQDW